MARRRHNRGKKKGKKNGSGSRQNKEEDKNHDEIVSEKSATSDAEDVVKDETKEHMDSLEKASALEESNLNDLISQLENAAVGSATEFKTEIKVSEDKMTSNLNQKSNAAASLPPEIKSMPFTATVYLAAPHKKNHSFAIIGKNEFLGEWKNPQGNFKHLIQINEEFSIYKGTVPVPSFPGYSPFKFVRVDKKDKSLVYEGEGPLDNRTDLLMADSWNFFIFKVKPTITGIMGNLWGGFLNFVRNPETKKKIAIRFFNITFSHVVENLLPDWTVAYNFVSDCLTKIRREIGNNTSDIFRDFLNSWLENPKVNFDQLLLLVVGASEMKMYSENMKNFFQKNSQEFSLHLHGLGIFNNWNFIPIFEQLANHAGPNYWWIFFRIHRFVESLEKIKRQEMSDSIVKTLESIPEVVLDCAETTSRVIDYLLRFNDIDQLYCKLQTVFARKNATNYQHLLDPFLFNKLLNQTKRLDNLIKIFNSDFIRKIYENGLARSVDLNESQESDEKMELNLFDQFITNVFSSQKKLSDKMKLAINTPDYLLQPAVTIIEDVIAERKTNNLDFDRDDYVYFANFENVRLDHFPQAKEYIEAKLLRVTKNYLESSSFERIPTLKLTLLGLSEMNLPLLESPNIVDLRKSITSLPPNFFQNLLVALKKLGDLKIFRHGETKNVVERLENHFDQIAKIVEKVQNHRVQLFELKSLLVSISLFFTYWKTL